MIELRKGDWNNLEGRLVSYSKLTNKELAEQIETPLMAMYASFDPLDFIERMGLNEDGKRVIESLKQSAEKTVEDFRKKGVNITAMPLYGAPIVYEDEQDLMEDQNDIIFAGEWERPECCVEATQMGVRLYTMKYMESFLKKHNVDTPKQKVIPKEQRYTEYIGKSLRTTILNDYVNPIIDARNSGDLERANILGLRLVHFVEGSNFVTDGLELISIAKNAKSKKEYDLIDCYLNKIDAIHLERFEEAARYRDAIVAAKKR